MKKEHIDFLSKSTGIAKKFYPMDIYFLSKTPIKLIAEEEAQETKYFQKPIQIDKINYQGTIRLVSYAQLSLIINPDEVI